MSPYPTSSQECESKNMLKIIELLIKKDFFFNQYVKAHQRIEHLLKAKPDDVDVLMLALQFYVKILDWKSIYDTYSKLEKVHPVPLQIKKSLATGLMSIHHYDEAIPNLLFCIDNWNMDASYDAALANLHARLALCYLYCGKSDLSKIHFKIAEEKAPWDLDVLYYKLLIGMRAGEFDKVLSFLDNRIQEHPALYTIYYWKALYVQYYLHDAHQSLSLHKSAIDKFNALRSDFLSNFFSSRKHAHKETVLKSAVEAHVSIGQRQKAKLLIYLTKLRCWEIDLQILLVYYDILVGDFKVAEHKCLNAINRKSYLGLASEYWELLGLAQLGLGKLEAAAHSCIMSLELNPDSYDTMYILGLVQMQRGELTSAINTFQNMLAMEPLDFRCWQNIGFCEFELGNMELAKISYEKVLLLNPFEAETWIDFGNLLVEQGESEQAVFAIKKGMSFGYLTMEKRSFAEKLLLQIKM